MLKLMMKNLKDQKKKAKRVRVLASLKKIKMDQKQILTTLQKQVKSLLRKKGQKKMMKSLKLASLERKP